MRDGGVIVNRKELVDAWARLRKLARARGLTEAYVFCSDGAVKFQVKTVRVGVAGTGDLPATVAVNAELLTRAGGALPLGETLVVNTDGKELWFGSLSITCRPIESVPDLGGPLSNLNPKNRPPTKR